MNWQKRFSQDVCLSMTVCGQVVGKHNMVLCNVITKWGSKTFRFRTPSLFYFCLTTGPLQVVSPLLDQFCMAIGPVSTTIGRKCVTHDLIGQADFDDLRAQEIHGHGNRVICDQLFNKLKEKGQTGFDEFKKILSTWPSMSSPRVLLRNIQDVQRKVVEGVSTLTIGGHFSFANCGTFCIVTAFALTVIHFYFGSVQFSVL